MFVQHASVVPVLLQRIESKGATLIVSLRGGNESEIYETSGLPRSSSLPSLQYADTLMDLDGVRLGGADLAIISPRSVGK